MAASLYDRACCFGDWENDGGSINPTGLVRVLTLYAAGLVNDAYVKANCASDEESALTVAQESDIDDILATMPGTLLSLVGAFNKALWAAKVECVLWAGREQRTGFTTEALVKTALGV